MTSSRQADLAAAGEDRIAWAAQQMGVLTQIRERFAVERPLDGVVVLACLHVTAETANLMDALTAGGAKVRLCAANPLATQDEVAAALAVNHGVQVDARRADDFARWEAQFTQAVQDVARQERSWLVIDDGGELLTRAHANGARGCRGLIGATEETTTGLARLRALDGDSGLRCPVLAVNEAQCERQLNDRHGTGQSALDGIVRATNLLLAGQTLVVIGYGSAGQGIAERARGAGAAVIVCEVDPLRALSARMAGYNVMPVAQASERGDLFVTVTGSERVLRGEHFERMKDGAVLANAGRFDVEIDLTELAAITSGSRRVRPLVDRYELADGRRLNLLALGQVVNLAAADGHPAAVMDISFALQALSVELLVGGGTGARGGTAFADDDGRPTRVPLAPGVHPVPLALERELARLKLASLGVEIDG